MRINTFINRLLLTLLLLSTSMATACAGGYRSVEKCKLPATTSTALVEDRHQHPLDAVLSGIGYFIPAASLPNGPAGGQGGVLPLVPVFENFTTLLSHSGSLQLRYWRLLYSAVQYEQLRARYPAHGFW